MNAHIHSTNVPANARPVLPALDLSTVGVGSCVYVRPNEDGLDPDYGDAEGMQYVAAVDGDLMTGDTGEKFLRRHVIEHLEGVIVRNHVVTNNNHRDQLLVAMGAELAILDPHATALWKAAQKLRPALDEANAAAERLNPGLPMGHIAAMVKAEHPAAKAYDAAIERYNVEGGNRAYMLTCTINRCRAHTPLGVAYKALGLLTEVRNEDAPGESENTWMLNRLSELYEDAMATAHSIDPPQPTGTLAELIAAHQAAVKAFDATFDAEDAARDALNALHKQSPGMTPGRFRNGKPAMALEVFGINVGQDVAAIESAHAHWELEFNVRQIEVIAPKAAKMIRAEIAASLAQCLKVYHEETLPKLQERNAPFVADIAAHQAADDAEEAALDDLTRYRPASMAEVAQLARYLKDGGRFESFSTTGKAEQLLATMSTLDAEF